jgi:hypothetical protein
MTRARNLVWLIALIAFVVPSFGTAVASHAMTHAEGVGAQAAMVDCADHGPSSEHCPDEATAKHAAGLCCPLMSGTVALLPSTAAEQAPSPVEPPLSALAHRLSGLTFTRDPPPPRA